MLFSNTRINAKSHQDKQFVELGGSKAMLAVPKEVRILEKNKLYRGLTVDCHKGNVRISKGKDQDIYLILSPRHMHSTRGFGCVKCPKRQTSEVIIRNAIRSPYVGEISSWDDIIVRAHEGDIFMVTWAGHHEVNNSQFFIIHDEKVYTAEPSGIKSLYRAIGTPMPFRLSLDGLSNMPYVVNSEWKIL